MICARMRLLLSCCAASACRHNHTDYRALRGWCVAQPRRALQCAGASGRRASFTFCANPAEGQPTKQPQSQLEFSSICPGGFGLKVGLLTREGSDEMEFRDILGWITVLFERGGFERASHK